ncbi:MAG: Na/Pi cotransporter family protein [Ruminococcus sp.]|nr:Na/Pi cotransporter family protein [Ruminococcus sp.]
MDTYSIVLKVILALGGLGLFLIGMKNMGEGLELAAGNKLRTLLAKITSNKFIAMLVGTLVTAVIQSSSATDAMVVGFANAGLMELGQAIGILFGAKIGTTVTSLLMAIDIKAFVPICIFIGAIIITFSRKNNHKYYGQIAAGFGMLFLGLSLMSDNLKWMGESNAFRSIADDLSFPLIGILVGIIFTGIIQSSSASVGILMALAMAGVIQNLNEAVFVIYGFNVGACSAALLSSMGANRTAKQIALSNFLISAIGAVIMTLVTIFLPFTAFIDSVLPAKTFGLASQISATHIVFNIAITVILLPFSGLIERFTKLLLPDLSEDREKMETVYLDTRILTTPPMAVLSVENECKRLGELAQKNYKYAMRAFFEHDASLIDKVHKNEKVIDFLTSEITRYIVKINGLDILDSDRKTMGVMYSAIQDLERIGDHAENIVGHAQEMMDNKVKFSEHAMKELHKLDDLTSKLIEDGLTMFNAQSVDFDLAKRIIEAESSLDSHVKRYKYNHIARMNSGECSAENGTIYLDMLTILERVGDHANNVAFSIPRNKLNNIAAMPS